VTGSWQPAVPGERPLGEDVHVWRMPTARPGALEGLIASYLAVDADRVRVERGDGGKPRLADAATAAGLQFNVTHTGCETLVALCAAHEVGVDMESLERDVSGWRLPAHALAASEQEALDGSSGRDRGEAVLRMWVRKEALLKAAGVGLAVEPATIVLQGTDVVAVPPALAPRSRWTVTDLPFEGHAAAVAVDGDALPVRCFELTKR
jgi:4'-phosphopantetheinyl transferase